MSFKRHNPDDDTVSPEEDSGSRDSGAARVDATRPEHPVKTGPRSSTLGSYKIVREIGRGGMGVVYEAFHSGLKRKVALKVLIAGEDASEEAISRFGREAEAVAKLGHHPSIVPVYDVGSEGNLH